MRSRLILPLLLLFTAACATTRPQPGTIATTEGLASWYGQEFAGRTTANGEIFDPNALTAAHRTLPFGTLVEVTNVRTGRSVTVRINDRGPFIESRIIDLSYAAAREIDMVEAGVTRVRIDVLRVAEPDAPPKAYVVRVEEPSEKIEVPRIPDAPPEVAFPLPDSSGSREQHGRVQVEEVTVDDITVEVVEGNAPPARRTVDPSGTRVIPAPVAPAGGDGYVLQLGAFGAEENARKLAASASQIDPRVFVREIAGLWRVRVGPLSDRVAAIELAEKFDLAGFPSLIVDLNR